MRILALALIFMLPLAAQVAPKVIPSPLDPTNRPDAIPLLILGSFHMDNPGQDAFSSQVEDVLGPQKQLEISELRDRLAAFRPTKILIESPAYRSPHTARFEQYLAGTYTLGRNEIDQIGFALAKRLGHRAIYPVDFPMWMDGRMPQEIGTLPSAPKPAQPAAIPPVDTTPEVYRVLQRKIKEESVLSVVRYLNSPEYALGDNAFYVRMLQPELGSDDLYGGANALTNWAKRNLRILSNLYRVAEPGDRLLLLIGSGHLTPLNQWAQGAQDLALMNTLAYLD